MSLVDRLKQYNAWRREDGPDRPGMPEPRQIGHDLDEAVDRIAAAEKLAEAVEKYKSARKKWTKRDRVLKHLCGKQHAAKRDTLLKAMLDARKNMEDLAAYIQNRKGQDDA